MVESSVKRVIRGVFGSSGPAPAADRDRRACRGAEADTAGRSWPGRGVGSGEGAERRWGAIVLLRARAQGEQEGVDRSGIRDGRDQSQAAAAVRTDLHVQIERPA